MTSTDFLNKILTRKSTAHTLYEHPEGYQIRRGMGHSISGYAEDLFAVYVAKNLKKPDLIFYVDKVISYRTTPDKKAISFKPDLLILNGDVATSYYDLKTDIGFGRNMKDYLIMRNSFILSLRGQQAWITIGRKIEHRIKFTDNIKYSIVIVLDWNVNKKILEENIQFAKSLDGIDLYVLLNKTEQKVSVNSPEFARLLSNANNATSIYNASTE